MTLRRLTGTGTAVDGLEPHYPHQPPDAFPVDLVALTFQPRGYLACSVERRNQVLTVDQLHKSESLLGDSNWLVVQARAADTQ